MPNIHNLEATADVLIQKASAAMWTGLCVYCNKVREGYGTGHHVIGCSYRLVRHELMNVPHVCPDCHYKIEKTHNGQRDFIQHLCLKWRPLYDFHMANTPCGSPPSYHNLLLDRIDALRLFINNPIGTIVGYRPTEPIPNETTVNNNKGD